MKKIVASVGLAALGASSLQAAPVPGITAPDAGKPWTISATIRGFYDDNINSAPDHQRLIRYDSSGAEVGTYDRDSFGFEVSPEFALAWSMQQTTINLGLLYSLRYYENIPTYANGMPARFTGSASGVVGPLASA